MSEQFLKVVATAHFLRSRISFFVGLNGACPWTRKDLEALTSNLRADVTAFEDAFASGLGQQSAGMIADEDMSKFVQDCQDLGRRLATIQEKIDLRQEMAQLRKNRRLKVLRLGALFLVLMGIWPLVDFWRAKNWQAFIYPNQAFEFENQIKQSFHKPEFDWKVGPPIRGMSPDHFSIDLVGCVRIEKSATFKAILGSDDGAVLTVDGKLVVDNGGPHVFQERDGKVTLEKGVHNFHIRYFEDTDQARMNLRLFDENGKELSLEAEATPQVLRFDEIRCPS